MSTCMTSPMPQPVTNMNSDASSVDVSGDSWARRKRPTDSTAVPGDRKYPVPAGAGHDLPTDGGGDQQAGHEGKDVQTRDGGRGSFDHLEVERQEGDGTEHGEPEEEGDHAGAGEDAVGEQPGRQHRLGRPSLHDDEDQQGHRP